MSQDRQPNHTSYPMPRTLRHWIVDPLRQVRLGVHVLALTVGFTLLLGVLLINGFIEQYRNVAEIFQIVDPKMQWELIANDVFYTNLWRMGLLLGVYLASLFVVVLRVTHQYYGPLVAIERFLDDLKAGQFESRMKLRRHDELQGLALRLNALAESLERQEKARRRQRGGTDSQQDPDSHTG